MATAKVINNVCTFKKDTDSICSKDVEGLTFKEVICPDSLKKIEFKTFFNNTTLEKITFNDLLLNVQIEAFANCSSLKEVHFNTCISTASQECFMNCTSLETFSSEYDGEFYVITNCFKNCKKLSTVDAKLYTILDSAFEGCSSLTKIDISNAKFILANAFTGTNIETFTLAKHFIELSPTAFDSLSLKRILYPGTLEEFKQCFFSEDSCEEFLKKYEDYLYFNKVKYKPISIDNLISNNASIENLVNSLDEEIK